MHGCRLLQSPEGGIRSLELELQAAVSSPMWMPGTELRSYTQQLLTFNHGAISLAPSLGFKGIYTLIPVEAGLVYTPTGSVHEVPLSTSLSALVVAKHLLSRHLPPDRVSMSFSCVFL